ncbi:MAG: cbb3-type cytochrome c oxidase subunit 3 [Pseudomonadota bacterium]
MDINDLRGLSTLFMFVSFVGLCVWAYSSKRKQSFDEAANLPFADEELNQRTMQEDARNG